MFREREGRAGTNKKNKRRSKMNVKVTADVVKEKYGRTTRAKEEEKYWRKQAYSLREKRRPGIIKRKIIKIK